MIIEIPTEDLEAMTPVEQAQYQRYLEDEAYRVDPAAWVRDRLHEELWSKQAEIAQSVVDNRFTAVPSCHGAGKSYLAARLIAWWLDTNPPGEAFALSTAPTFSQVRAILWREIGRAHRHGHLAGRVNQTEWHLPVDDGEELVAYGRKPSNWDPSAFQGIHAPRVLVVLDEACGVPKSIWTAAETLVTTDESRILAIGNPDDPVSEFAKVCKPKSGWNVVHIAATDTPNFTGEQVTEAVARELTSVGWVEERKTRWGEGSQLYVAKVDGRFPDSAKDTLVPLGWIERAFERYRKRVEDDEEVLAGPSIIGCDVAREGDDETVIGILQARTYRTLETYSGSDTMETAGNVKRAVREHKAVRAHVDVIGVGGGVVDRLKELKEPVVGLNAGWASDVLDDNDRPVYANVRAEWYWNLRTLLDPRNAALDLEPDEDLAAELSQIKWKTNSLGQIIIEPKPEMKKRLGHSPDRADTLMLAAAPIEAPDPAVVVDDEDFDEDDEYERHGRIHISDY